ncbi:MAG: pseudouridine-5'-phosphate glycosidase [Coxiellaceae bacterium]|nr:pseudouridine-5'-phosphate glycosidase [Coxiellaceae bacterium]
MLEQYLDINPEVQAALAAGKPVVALESTIISHGMPYPQNVETALKVEKIIRDNGAIPATISILKGRLKVGMTTEEIEYLGKAGLDVIKTSRRDIPFIVAQQSDGATTVASTMILADMAGIKVFATGGIGGVHRGAQQTFDISADLQELAHTDVAVVCAGAKSILDIGLTLEYLETQGVPVVGYQTDTLPAFYTRDSEFGVDYRLDSSHQIAAAMKAKWGMSLKGGMVIANPIPKEFAMNSDEITKAINDAVAEMEVKGISGKDSTPFLLAKVAEHTQGNSLKSNIALVFNNAKLAAEIAVAFVTLRVSAHKSRRSDG